MPDASAPTQTPPPPGTCAIMRDGTARTEGGEGGGLEGAIGPGGGEVGGTELGEEIRQDSSFTQHLQLSSSSISSISDVSASSRPWRELTAEECMGRTPAKCRRTEVLAEAEMDTSS